MKIYILKKPVKVNGRIAFQKGDKFFASDICKGEKGKPIYYPVGMMPDEYKPNMMGLDMTQNVGLLMASWQNSLYKGNHHLRGAKFKVVEDKTIAISPEHKLFWDAIQQEIADNNKAVSKANNNLKFLKTIEVILRSGVLYTSPVVSPAPIPVEKELNEVPKFYMGYTVGELEELITPTLYNMASALYGYRERPSNRSFPSLKTQSEGVYKESLIRYIIKYANSQQRGEQTYLSYTLDQLNGFSIKDLQSMAHSIPERLKVKVPLRLDKPRGVYKQALIEYICKNAHLKKGN